MKKSETNACLIAGVLATSILLTGCGGGSGGGMSGLGDPGAVGATGATGATGTTATTNLAGTVDNLTDLLGTNGVDVNLAGLGDDVNLRALSERDLANLDVLGIVPGGEDVQVLEAANGDILGITNGTTALGLPGANLPAGIPTLPTVPVNVGNALTGLRL